MASSQTEAVNGDKYVLLPTEEPEDKPTDKLVTITEYRDHEHATT
jgi:hypothetical protein